MIPRNILLSLGLTVAAAAAIACARTSEMSMYKTGPHEPTGGWPRKNTNGANIGVHVDISNTAGPVDLSTPLANDVLLATFENLGTGTERMYHFAPKADFVYRLYAIAGTPARWAIRKVTPGGVETPHPIATGHFNPCNDGHVSTTLDVAFHSCGEPWAAAAVKKSAMVPSGFVSGMVTVFRSIFAQDSALKYYPPEDDPAWVTCNTGCCTLAT